MFRVEDEGVLHITLIAVSFDAYLVEMRGMFSLSPFAFLLNHTNTPVKDIVAIPVMPTVLQVPLTHVWLIQKTVVVIVVMTIVVLIMQQQLTAQFVRKMDIGIGIGVHAAFCVAVKVQRGAFFVIRFQILHINLSCDAFVTVFD